MNKTIRRLLLVVFAVVWAFSLRQLWGIFGEYREGADSYSDLEQYVSFGETVEAVVSDASVPETEPENTEAPDLSGWPQVDFGQLSQINPDVVGWIFIEGTNINYPVVQGSDNDYYLRHLFDGTYNRSGCIFLDAGCAADFSDRHSIIYGHNMRDDSMFAGLVAYKDQAFYDAHSEAMLVTPSAYYKIRFFSGYVSDIRANAWDLSLDEYEHIRWLGEIQKKSCFEAEDTPTKADQIVTLSTCTYEFDTAKFVLHGYITEVIAVNRPGE